ncbi:MAG: glycosyltransferase [Gemmatimonadota bacterium]|nr:glycosyltransferase [Gemmatimonadota bacterium]
MSLAIVVDWLTDAGGGESVLSETLKTFPGATVHALIDIMSSAEHERLGIPPARTSWLQRVPGIERSYRSWLPLMPRALGSLDLSGADVVLAISHAVAKSAPVRDDQKLLCLCLSPMRYAWDLRAQYLEESGLDRGPKGAVARLLLDRMQEWDFRTAARVDAFASISRHIQERVKRCYGRESVVIYPPVDVGYYGERGSGGTGGGRGTTGPGEMRSGSGAGGPYVTASRFVPYKRVDLIVRAFGGDAARRLVVIGDGPDRDKVRAAATGAHNVTFIGHAGRDVLREHLRGARAFVFAAEEDFGIVPVEAQACGTPVIAYGKGGALETVVPLAASAATAGGARPTGLFFGEQTVESLREALDRFERAEDSFDPAACRANAEGFAAPRFRRELAHWVGNVGAVSSKL